VQQRQPDPLEGSLVDGRYLVRSRLARGGMSTVYLATDRRLERDVALKVLYPHLAQDSTLLARFEQEAKSAARLSHPHVVGVLDQGVDGQTAYLVMEYVPGRTLRDLLREQGRLTPRQALAMVDAVSQGLGAAHDAGLIHRDIKPENVLLGRDGRIKVADFGLARAVSTQTGTGTLLGTVAYVPPELVTGGSADARSDIYSTGIMLFELLTGQQPFTGELPIQVAFQHVNSAVPAPSTLLPGLAPDLDELVQWCTAADPDARPVDGDALLGELRHIRTTLADTELDYPQAPQQAGATDAPHAAPVDAAQPTEVLQRSYQPTTVIPPGSRDGHQGAPFGADPAWEYDDGPVTDQHASRTDRQARRELNAYRKEQARAALRPANSLLPARARRRNAVVTALLVLLAVLAVGLGWFFGAGPGVAVAVPDVAGRTSAEAQALLSRAGLDSSTRIVFHEETAEGRVVRSEPAAETRVRRYQPITLIVSRGPELFGVPDLRGMTEAAAARQVAGTELRLGKVSQQYSDSVDPGRVISQKPPAGSDARRGTPIRVAVSRGPEPVGVPAVVGQPRDAAVAAIEAAGLTAAMAPQREHSLAVPAGSVVRQAPAGGQLPPGGTVTLTLSLGPRMVEVPNVFSKSEKEAVAVLEDAGFAVEVDYTFGESVLGLVAGQDKTGKQPEGSTVTLTVT
jgi:beta-lactam-binding protein with PASTA domain